MKDSRLNTIYKQKIAQHMFDLLKMNWVRKQNWCGTVRIKIDPKVYLPLLWQCRRQVILSSILSTISFEIMASEICTMCMWFTDSIKQLENVYYVYSISRNEHGKAQKKRIQNGSAQETLTMKFVSVKRVTFGGKWNEKRMIKGKEMERYVYYEHILVWL